jgi:hypothetical protein
MNKLNWLERKILRALIRKSVKRAVNGYTNDMFSIFDITVEAAREMETEANDPTIYFWLLTKFNNACRANMKYISHLIGDKE